MGERIGGSDLSPQVEFTHRNKNAIDQLTLNTLLVGEEGQGKKSEGAKCTGQKGGPCETSRRREWEKCAGQHTKKNRCPDRANRPGEGLFCTVSSLACIERAKEEKYF